MLIGRNAGQVVDMPYDRAIANLELGHVERVGVVVERVVPPAVLEVERPIAAPAEPPRPRPRGRPRKQPS